MKWYSTVCHALSYVWGRTEVTKSQVVMTCVTLPQEDAWTWKAERRKAEFLSVGKGWKWGGLRWPWVPSRTNHEGEQMWRCKLAWKHKNMCEQFICKLHLVVLLILTPKNNPSPPTLHFFWGALYLSYSGSSHVGLLCTNEEQKRVESTHTGVNQQSK